jgi:hypothetical protein
MDNYEKDIKTITSTFKKKMLNFAKTLSDKYDIKLDNLLELWNEESFIEVKIKKPLSEDDKLCEGLYTTGKRCEYKVIPQSITGKYCGRHIKYEKEN